MKEPVRFIRIMIPDSTMKGKSVGIMFRNQRFSPFKAKYRLFSGKSRMTAVSPNTDKEQRNRVVFFFKGGSSFLILCYYNSYEN